MADGVRFYSCSPVGCFSVERTVIYQCSSCSSVDPLSFGFVLILQLFLTWVCSLRSGIVRSRFSVSTFNPYTGLFLPIQKIRTYHSILMFVNYILYKEHICLNASFFFYLFFFIFFFLFFFCETSQYLALFAATIFPISTPTRTLRRPSPPQPALFAEVRTLPIFQHFSSKSLSFNMADLGGKYSDSTDFSTFFFKIPIF